MKRPDLKLPELNLEALDLAAFDRLSQRERRLLVWGGAAIAAMVLVLAVGWFRDRGERIDRRAAAARAQLAQIDTLLAEYQALERSYEELRERAERQQDPLPRVIETHARRSKVAESITTIRERAAPPPDPDFTISGVEVQIEDAPLAGLVDLMAALEQDRRSLLQFGRVNIEGQGDVGSRVMDANIQVLRFESQR